MSSPIDERMLSEELSVIAEEELLSVGDPIYVCNEDGGYCPIASLPVSYPTGRSPLVLSSTDNTIFQ